MKRLLALMLVLCSILCACAAPPVQTTVPPTTVPETTVPPTTAPPETTVPPTTVPPTEPPPVDTNPLTGEALEAVSDARPIAIMINNLKKAVPQCGISRADLLYEILAEGDVTRFMAIFTDLSDVGTIGPVRSVRPYFVRVAQHYGAILSSAGGSDEAYDLIDSIDIPYLNGIGNAGSWFYRDDWRRKNKGFEHSLMTTGEKLLAAAQKRGVRTTMEDTDFGFRFDDGAALTGEAAQTITIRFYSNGKKTTMTYDADSGRYTMSQHGAVAVDGNDDTPLTFRNVLILVADTYVKDKKGHLSVQMTGSGDGWFARDGQIIPIRWSREGNGDHYVYTDAAGNPISFGVGKSYIAITPDGSKPSWE